MDILTRDSQKLALLKEDIMLLPNSLKVQDFLPDLVNGDEVRSC